MAMQLVIAKPRKAEKLLPRVVMDGGTKAPREVGGKTYCTIHGRAHLLEGGCPACATAEKPKQIYKNIVLTSRKTGRPVGINNIMVPEVISVHFVGSAEEAAAEERRLKALHGIR